MSDLAQQRQQAHALLDQLPPLQLAAVRRLLEVMVEPLARGEGIPHEEVLRNTVKEAARRFSDSDSGGSR